MIVAAEDRRSVAVLKAGKLTLYRDGREAKCIDAPFVHLELAFVQEKLLALDLETGALLVLDQRLETVTTLTLDGGSRIIDVSANIAAVLAPSRRLDVLTFAQRAVRATRLLQLHGVAYGCADQSGIFYLGTDTRLQRWDFTDLKLLSGYRAVFDFTPTHAGRANGRFMWFARAGHALEVFRVSDWQRRAPLMVVDAVRSSSTSRFIAVQRQSAWTLLDIENGKEAHRLEGAIADVCILPGREPAFLCELEDGELRWHNAPPPPVEKAPAMAPAAPSEAPHATATEPPAAVVEPTTLGKWRADLFGVTAKPSPLPAPPPATAEASAPEPAPAVEAPAPLRSWRERLLRWKPRSTNAAPIEGTLRTLTERLLLSDAAARAVAVLYRRRLLGLLPPAPAQLAAAIGGADCWREALGQGELARLGVVEAGDARPQLTAAARRFLDGAEASFVALEPGQGPALRELELWREPAADRAAELASTVALRTQSPLAWHDPAPRTRDELLSISLAARLHGRVALCLFAGEPPDGILGALPHPALLVVASEALEIGELQDGESGRRVA